MRTSSRILFLIILTSAWWACGSPAGPSVLIKEIVISGPSQLSPGATVQLRATAKYTDGSSPDVTSEANWQSLTPEVLRFTSAGSAYGVSRGETVISVEFHGAKRTQLMMILEPGTYKLYGLVTEERERLEGAMVEVVTGTGAGLKTKTDFRGQYALYGVAGAIQLRVSARGFTDQTLNVTVSTHTVQNLQLIPLAASVNLAGSWRLAITAPPDCSGKLPEDVRQREFNVSITQAESHITLRPSSPTIASGGSIEGRIFRDTLSASLWYDDYYLAYGLLDRPGPADWVGIRGTIEGSSTASSVEGAFSGAFDYYHTTPEAKGPGGVPVVCLGNSTFSLTRESPRQGSRR
jgi:hypothetical protein